MIFISTIIASLQVLEGYLLSKILQKKIKAFHDINPTFLGILSIFGIFEFAVYPIVAFNIPVMFMLFFFILLLILIPVMAFIFRIQWKPTKHDLYGFGFALIICIAMFCISYHMTLGEKPFDSVYYLSMVLENSSKSILGSMWYYSGGITEHPSALYDFQGFYYVFSMILKIIRNLPGIHYSLLTPVYIWSASILYYFTLGLTVFECITFFAQKNKGRFLILLCLLIPYFCNYYNTGFGFFGNTYKNLAIASIMFLLFKWFQDREDSLLTIVFLMISALISFSSSGFFIGFFILAGFFFYLVFTNDTNYKHYQYCILCALPIILFALQYVYYGGLVSYSTILFIGILAGYIFLVLFGIAMKHFKNRAFRIYLKAFKIMFVLLTAAMVVISFQLKNTEFSYGYFFKGSSSFDMEPDLFQTYNTVDLLRTIIFWFSVLLFILNRKFGGHYKGFILMIVILFLNPLVEPFVATYITDIVYSRSFEIVVNPFILCFVFYGAILFLTRKVIQIGTSIILSGCSLIVAGYKVMTPYSSFLVPGEDYNAEYKINNNEIEIFDTLRKETENNDERVFVITQNAAVKGYLSNIYVRLTVDDFRFAPVYEDHDEDTDDINLYFYPRDYDGQEIWNREPDYSKIAQVAYDSGASYIIMSTHVTIQDETGTYVPLYFNIREVADVIEENDDWVLMKVR